MKKDRRLKEETEQVIPAQINKLKINGNSSDKDFNKQTDNNKTENNAIEHVHNNKASNESKTTASTGSETGEKEESNSKETTSTSEIEKEKDTTNKTSKEQLDETKDTGNGKKVLQNSAQTQTQSARENSGKENTEQAQIMETINEKEKNI